MTTTQNTPHNAAPYVEAGEHAEGGEMFVVSRPDAITDTAWVEILAKVTDKLEELIDNTAASTVGAGGTELTTAKTPRRTKVVHLYRVGQARLAEAVGLPTPYLCGRVAKRPTRAATERRVEVIGGLMSVTKARDCRQCVRAHEAYLAGLS